MFFAASKIITMERENPVATAVAVSGGKILAVGSLDQVRAALGDRPARVDRTFADKAIAPGKIANFTVLGEDPYAVEPMKLREIRVWGAVFEGAVFPVVKT